jgi:glycosyltransferase involved in cell wall biosynthesis
VYNDKVISISVPAHNESALIQKTITTMPDFVDHIVVVDDCSDDDTSAKAEAVGDPRVHVIRHEVNKGNGGSIITAHRKGLELGADIIVVMDGDAQMDPDYLEALVEPVASGEYGFAKANRFYSMDSFRGMPNYRIFGNVVLSFMTKLSSGYWNLFDPQNGYTAVSAAVLKRLNLDRISATYEFQNDLLINLNILDVRACDVSVPAIYGDEVSGIKLRKVVPAIARLLFKGFWKRLIWKYVFRSFSPIALFFFTGIFMVLWGIFFGIYVLAQRYPYPGAPTATVMISFVPFMIGIQLLLSALTLDIQQSPDR